MKRFIFLSALALLLTGCSSDEPAVNGKRYPRHIIELNSQQQIQRDQANDFAYKIWEEVNKTDPSDNIIFSPLSLYQALAMTANGADGETLEAFKSFLTGRKDGSIENINDFNKFLMNELPKVDPAVTLTLINMYCSRTKTPLTEFSKVLDTYYNAPFYKYDTEENGKRLVNEWVRNATNNMIPDFLGPNDELTDLDLFNATYFSGPWAGEINKSKTEIKTFHNASGSTSDVRMMYIPFTFLSQTDKAAYFDLTYGNTGYDLSIVIPIGNNDLYECMTAELPPTDKLAYANFATVWFPIFDFEYKSPNWVDLFGRMGLTPVNDLRRMLQGGGVLKKIMQKSHLKVSEEGTEAAATTQSGTIAGGSFTGIQSGIVVVDEPFGFVIRENSTNTILFMGRVTEL